MEKKARRLGTARRVVGGALLACGLVFLGWAVFIFYDGAFREKTNRVEEDQFIISGSGGSSQTTGVKPPDVAEDRGTETRIKELASAVDINRATNTTGPGGSTGPNGRVPLSRYCGISTPVPILPNSEFDLQVLMTDDPEDILFSMAANDPEGAKQVEMALPPLEDGERSWAIDVTLAAPQFRSMGSNASTLQLFADGTSTPAQFRLKAPPEFVPEKSYRVLTTFSYEGRFLARLVLDLPTEIVTEEYVSSGGPLASIDLMTSPPDLTVVMSTLSKSALTSTVRVEVQSPFLQSSYQDVEFPNDMSAWIGDQLQSGGIVASRGEPAFSNQARALSLEGLGRQLYERFSPTIFREAFWKLVDERGAAFDTIQIATDNPNLPFELMRPSRPGRSSQRGFLGVDFTVARIHLNEGPGVVSAPPNRISLRSLRAIVPSYEGSKALAEQTREVDVLRQMNGFQEVEPSLSTVIALFRDPPEGIIHFCGHGVVARGGDSPKYRLQLEDGPIDLLTFRGVSPVDGSARPFLFLNACDVGSSHRVANFVDGWAPAALEYGASGVVGSLWPVTDKAAATVSARFYGEMKDRLDAGEPFLAAEALRRTRAMHVEAHDESYMAYVFYGHPSVAIVSP